MIYYLYEIFCNLLQNLIEKFSKIWNPIIVVVLCVFNAKVEAYL